MLEFDIRICRRGGKRITVDISGTSSGSRFSINVGEQIGCNRRGDSVSDVATDRDLRVSDR